MNKFVWATAVINCIALFFLVKYGTVDVPRWDDWDSPGDLIVSDINSDVTWHSFLRQHNEARIVFTQAVQLAIAKRFGWNSNILHYVNWFVLSIVILMCAFAISRNNLKSSGLATWFAVLAICFMGSFAHWQNLLWSVQLIILIVLACGIGGTIVHNSDIPYWKKTTAAIVFSIISTFSFTNGMMLWFLLWPGWMSLMKEPKLEKVKSELLRFETFIYAAAAIAVIVGFFWNYHRPPYHPPLAVSNIGYSSTYLLYWFMGPFFISRFEYGGGVVHLLTRTGVVLLGLAGISAAIGLFVNRRVLFRALLTPQSYPWILLIAYALVSAVLTTLGRAALGISGSVSIRYGTMALCFYVGICGLVAVFLTNTKQLKKGLFFKLFSIFLSVALLWSCIGKLYEVKLDKAAAYRNRLTMELAEVLPQNRYLLKLYPQDTMVVRKITFLNKHHVFKHMPDYRWLPGALANPKSECKGKIVFSEDLWYSHFNGVISGLNSTKVQFVIAVSSADSGTAPILAIPCKQSGCEYLKNRAAGCVLFDDYIETNLMPPLPWKFVAVSTIDRQCYTVAVDTTRKND